MLTTDQIRTKYLEFFQKKGHTLVSSDSLVPQNDPTLLFTGAGMNQFKENFLGINKDLKRATTSQKCLRTGDLEEVGRTAFHHSFFEMLGNFSFGDYFKKEAIEWAWEFLTVELQIPKERLRVSVHKTDDEAFAFWEKIVGKDKIDRLGDKDNFWPSNAPKDGPNGPCGPCSEIYFDQNPDGGKDRTVEHKDFAEIWNLVFTQFDRQDGGKLVPLSQKNIDTGMGLERLVCVLQGKKTNYEIDMFQPIHAAIEKSLGVSIAIDAPQRRSLYAISDHIRAIFFCMADGVIPSNEGRGYVIRKLIRRALWHAHEIANKKTLESPFLFSVLPAVASSMKKPYPELTEALSSVQNMLNGEEQRFLETLETGLKILEDKIKDLKTTMIPGKIVFELYDTYGFPDELTKKIADHKGYQIDQAGFDKAMDEQRKRAKDATKISGAIFTATDLEKALTSVPASQFLGYETLEAKGKILYAKFEGNSGVIVLDQTPFYGESGGQVGDLGTIKGASFQAKVVDAQKKDKHFLHFVEMISGTPKTGDAVETSVDRNRRNQIMRNHTATHLLHAALRNILGPQVRQLGSLVAPDRLRFDYSYGQALTAEQVRQIEDSVNTEILKDTGVSKEEKDIEQAKKDGAIAFFGEKYGARVRIVTVPGYSKEFCGGTHCDRTGQIGSFIIVSDSSIASGTRRIEALSGEGALNYLRSLRGQVQQLTQALKTTPDKLLERVSKLQDSYKKMEKDLAKGAGASAQAQKPSEEKSFSAGGYQFTGLLYSDLSVDGLRKQSDDIRSKSQKTLYFLGAAQEDKIHFVVGLSHDSAKSGLDVRVLGKKVAETLSGSCGGRPDMVQGGAPNNGQLSSSFDGILNAAKEFLTVKGS